MTEPSRVKPWYKLSKVEWLAACKAALVQGRRQPESIPTPKDEEAK